jgi:CRISPR/Cas system-associated exonuclease Cas4 (RecB family)
MPTLAELLVKVENERVREPDVDLFQHPLAVQIDEFLEEDQKHQFRQAKGFYPSDDKMCARYWVYLFRGVPIEQNHDARLLRIFDMGNDVHERYERYFREMGILIEAEMKVPDRDGYPKVRGYIDDVIKWGGGEGRAIVEMKSIGDRGFDFRIKYKKPKKDHIHQIQMYMHYTQIHDGMVVYENKNTQQILVFTVEYDEEYCEKVMKKYRKFHQAYKDGILPVRPYKRTSKNCEYCRVRELCWNDKNEGVKITGGKK